MNHDYAHCLDYSPNCPKDCFRGMLIRDLRDNNKINLIGTPIAWSHFDGTDECKKGGTYGSRKRRNAGLVQGGPRCRE